MLSTETENGDTKIYFNKNDLVKRDGNLFVWLMATFKKPASFGKSFKELIVTDCKKPYSFRTLQRTFYKGEMGEGEIDSIAPKESLDKEGLQFAVTNSLKEHAMEEACNYSLTN